MCDSKSSAWAQGLSGVLELIKLDGKMAAEFSSSTTTLHLLLQPTFQALCMGDVRELYSQGPQV